MGGIQPLAVVSHDQFFRSGWNMKACEMNAAFGLAQLKKLEHFKAAVGSLGLSQDWPG